MVPDGLKNSNDEYAQDCYSYIESAVDMSSFIDQMDVPDDAQKSKSKAAGAETWQWTWAYGGESFTFYWSYEEAGGKSYWVMDFKWDTQETGVDYLILYQTVINADGSGTIDYYSMDELFYHMAWDVLGNGTWVWYSNGDEVMSGLWTV